MLGLSVGLLRDLEDIRSIVLKESGATPVYIRDVADVRMGSAVRMGAMIKGGYTEATGGIGLSVSQRIAGNAAGRWIPLAGAAAVGAYAYWDTLQVANTAQRLLTSPENAISESA